MPPVVNLIKHFKNLESYWLENCSYYDSRVVIYARKNVYKMAIEKQESLGKYSFYMHAFYLKISFKILYEKTGLVTGFKTCFSKHLPQENDK